MFLKRQLGLLGGAENAGVENEGVECVLARDLRDKCT